MRIISFLLILLPALISGQDSNISWQKFGFGAPELHVMLPGKPLPQNSTLPQSVMNYIRKYDAYYLRDVPKGMVITMMHLTYTEDVTADPNGALEGTNGQWESTGTKVAILSTTETKISGKKALVQSGKLIMGGQENEYMDIVIVDGSRLWQAIVMIKTGDATLKTAMKKITDSLSF